MTAPSLLDELASEEKWLRQVAEEIAGEGHNGWGNTCNHAADRIERTRAKIADMAKRLEAAERDAARYRWLRDRMDSGDVAKVADVFPDGCEEISLKVDAAIDAAIAVTGNTATEQDQQLAATQDGEG